MIKWHQEQFCDIKSGQVSGFGGFPRSHSGCWMRNLSVEWSNCQLIRILNSEHIPAGMIESSIARISFADDRSYWGFLLCGFWVVNCLKPQFRSWEWKFTCSRRPSSCKLSRVLGQALFRNTTKITTKNNYEGRRIPAIDKKEGRRGDIAHRHIAVILREYHRRGVLQLQVQQRCGWQRHSEVKVVLGLVLVELSEEFRLLD